MRGLLTFAAPLAALLAAAPAAADVYVSEDGAVRVAVSQFFDALGSEDKTALADVMIPEGVIFVHNHMDPDNPRVDVVPVEQHLARWPQGTREVSEQMRMEEVLIHGDMAQVWGPYAFLVEGTVTHCGVNSLSLVRDAEGNWKVGNTSFTMVPREGCEALGMGFMLQ
jgi:ketosteroid isomerase-like protein